jgi:myo-inositol 2-dehydrogenase / D-chiro-inositol 1-dehydrogenase
MSNESNLNRRDFIGAVAVATAVMTACSRKTETTTYPDQAPDGRPLTAALIGCGGRGTGAARDFLAAGPNLQVIAVSDVFQDRVDHARKELKEKNGVDIPDSHCFVGFDAYKKAIDAGADVVLMASPPHFRPEQFAAAVDAGKHVFMEKPVGVDPVGCRAIIDSGKKAMTQGLTVVTGTQRRHQRSYLEAYKRIKDGAIGEILAARCAWNQSQLWYRNRQEGWSDMEWMIRDWVNWAWLSGDHIVEQHVHNIDVINWFTGSHPVRAVGFGGRARRVTGDQFDFFSVDFEMENGIHMHSMCRQITGCANDVSEYLVGTKGTATLSSSACALYKKDKEVLWQYEMPEGKEDLSPYVQEHVDMVTAIRNNAPINEAENTAVSTLSAVMGRIASYTGGEVTWDELMNSEMRLGPAAYELGVVPIEAKVAVPGTGPQVS